MYINEQFVNFNSIFSTNKYVDLNYFREYERYLKLIEFVCC